MSSDFSTKIGLSRVSGQLSGSRFTNVKSVLDEFLSETLPAQNYDSRENCRVW